MQKFSLLLYSYNYSIPDDNLLRSTMENWLKKKAPHTYHDEINETRVIKKARPTTLHVSSYQEV
jgi:hypothetical protein